jgi:hypothetical protein
MSRADRACLDALLVLKLIDIRNLTPPQLPWLESGSVFLQALKQFGRVPTTMRLEALVDALDQYDTLRAEYARSVTRFLEFRREFEADPTSGMAAFGPERILTLRQALLQAAAAYPLISVCLDEWSQDLIPELYVTVRDGLEEIRLVLVEARKSSALNASWAQLEQEFERLRMNAALVNNFNHDPLDRFNVITSTDGEENAAPVFPR